MYSEIRTTVERRRLHHGFSLHITLVCTKDIIFRRPVLAKNTTHENKGSESKVLRLATLIFEVWLSSHESQDSLTKFIGYDRTWRKSSRVLMMRKLKYIWSIGYMSQTIQSRDTDDMFISIVTFLQVLDTSAKRAYIRQWYQKGLDVERRTHRYRQHNIPTSQNHKKTFQNITSKFNPSI